MIIKLELTVEQANIVLAGLGKLPYEAAAPVVQLIHQQATSSQAQQGDENENNSAQS